MTSTDSSTGVRRGCSIVHGAWSILNESSHSCSNISRTHSFFSTHTHLLAFAAMLWRQTAHTTLYPQQDTSLTLVHVFLFYARLARAPPAPPKGPWSPPLTRHQASERASERAIGQALLCPLPSGLSNQTHPQPSSRSLSTHGSLALDRIGWASHMGRSLDGLPPASLAPHGTQPQSALSLSLHTGRSLDHSPSNGTAHSRSAHSSRDARGWHSATCGASLLPLDRHPLHLPSPIGLWKAASCLGLSLTKQVLVNPPCIRSLEHSVFSVCQVTAWLTRAH